MTVLNFVTKFKTDLFYNIIYYDKKKLTRLEKKK